MTITSLTAWPVVLRASSSSAAPRAGVPRASISTAPARVAQKPAFELKAAFAAVAMPAPPCTYQQCGETCCALSVGAWAWAASAAPVKTIAAIHRVGASMGRFPVGSACQHLAGVLARGLGDGLPAQHAGDLLDARLAVQHLDARHGRKGVAHLLGH